MDCADVEAAAELGRTLLERNRDLESTIRHQQVVLDDQSQEMEVNTTRYQLLQFPQYVNLGLLLAISAVAREKTTMESHRKIVKKSEPLTDFHPFLTLI